MQKDDENNKKNRKAFSKLDSLPWVPASSLMEAMAISRRYLQAKSEEEWKTLKNPVTNWAFKSLNNVNKRDFTVFLLNHHN